MLVGKNIYATAEDMAEYGWVLFETKEYLPSNAWFLRMLSVQDNKDWKDGYNGLGWSLCQINGYR